MTAEARLDGPKMRRRRNHRWLSQSEVARAVGVDQSTVAKWERRGVPACHAEAVAAVLGTTVEALS